MIPRLTRLFFCLICLFFASNSYAKYHIEGKINLGEEWQPKVFMAMVEKLSDYYRASPDLIVDIAVVNEDGSFVLEGKQLPEENRFYRLYLMKEQNTDYDACLYVGGDDHNFIHLILNNHSELEILADSSYYSPFGNYQVKGSTDNQLMRELARMVYPSFYFYQIRFPSVLKLTEERLFHDLKLFTDTCSSDMAALAAMANIDMEAYYEEDPTFFKNFGNRLMQSFPGDIYTENFQRKLQYFEPPVIVKTPDWMIAVVVLQGLLICLLLLRLLQLKKSPESKQEANTSAIAPIEKLTAKEQEILDLILTGKSNKEIASSLFIEVSTVKTHINKIYGKLEVKSRREVMNLKQLTPE